MVVIRPFSGSADRRNPEKSAWIGCRLQTSAAAAQFDIRFYFSHRREDGKPGGRR
jgi:hypothetical protein